MWDSRRTGGPPARMARRSPRTTTEPAGVVDIPRRNGGPLPRASPAPRDPRPHAAGDGRQDRDTREAGGSLHGLGRAPKMVVDGDAYVVEAQAGVTKRFDRETGCLIALEVRGGGHVWLALESATRRVTRIDVTG